MCMLPKECESCFTEIQEKTDRFLNEQKKSHKESLDVLETRHNEYLDKKDKRENRTSNMMLAALAIFAAVIGYLFDRQIALQSAIDLKANKNEVLRIEDAKTIRELGDKYYDARYIIRDNAEPDPINYKTFVETLFEKASRGGETAK